MFGFLSRVLKVLRPLFLCVLVGPLHAYLLDDPGVRWPEGVLKMRVKLGTRANLLDGSTLNDNAVAAFTEWNLNLKDLEFSWTLDPAGKGAAANGINEIFFSSDVYGVSWDPNVLSVVVEWNDGPVRKEADVILNSNWTWNAYRGPLRYQSVNRPIPELRRVLISSLGYVIGLRNPGYSYPQYESILIGGISDIEHLTLDDKYGGGVLYGFGAENIPPVPSFAYLSDSLSLYEEESATFMSRAECRIPFVYSWTKDGVKLDGWTEPTQKISSLEMSDSGSYEVHATSVGGTVSSTPIRLEVLKVPLPGVPTLADSYIDEGDRISLNGWAYSRTRVSYQWYHNGNPIEGATQDTFIVPVALKSDAGSYHVIVTNRSGSVQSLTGNVVVQTARLPKLSTFDSDMVIHEGDRTSLIFSVEGSNPVEAYWYKDGKRVGRNSSVLDLNNVTAGDAGAYVFVAENFAGRVESKVIHVRVEPALPASVFTFREGESVGTDGMNFTSYGDFTSNEEIRWFKNDVEIVASRNQVYLNQIPLSGAGDYEIRGFIDGRESRRIRYHYSFLEASPYDGIHYPGGPLESRERDGVMYFFFSGSSKLTRFHLATGKWLPELALPLGTRCFWPASDGLYIGFGSTISHLDLDGLNPRVVTEYANNPFRIFLFGDVVYSFDFRSNYEAYNRLTGAFVGRGSPWSIGSADFQLDESVGLAASDSASGHVVFSVDGSGKMERLRQTPRFSEIEYDDDFTRMETGGRRMGGSRGRIFDIGTGALLGGLGGNVNDLAFFDGKIVALRGHDLTLYDEKLREIGTAWSPQFGARMAIAGGNLVIFSNPDSTTGVIKTAQIPMDAFRPRASTSLSSSDPLAIDRGAVFVNRDGTILLLDRYRSVLHRWSPTSGTFLSDWILSGPARSICFSPELNRVYVAYAGGRITFLDAATGDEQSFATALSQIYGITCADSKLLVVGARSKEVFDQDGSNLAQVSSYSDFSHFLWNPIGRVVYAYNPSYGNGRFDPVSISESGSIGSLQPEWTNSPYVKAPGAAISPNGDRILMANGIAINSSTGAFVGNLGSEFVSALWKDSGLYAFSRRGKSSLLLRCRDSDLSVEDCIELPGTAESLVMLPSGTFCALTTVNEELRFFIVDEALNLVAGDRGTGPALRSGPVSKNVLLGGDFRLSAEPVGTSPLSYQWYHNGLPLLGANTATLRVSSASATDLGNYAVSVSDGNGVTLSSPAAIGLASTPARLANISTRSYVGPGGNRQIAGFYVGGSQAKRVLIRASGPALVPFGITHPLTNPTLTIYSGQSVIGFNDDWGAPLASVAGLTQAFADVGAFAWSPQSSDAAVVLTLEPGAYTAMVSDVDNASGTALVEAYELDRSTNENRLQNVSTRSFVRSGEDLQIAGFVISGNVEKKVLIRAVGPGLATFGVPGVLADPAINLISENGQVLSQNDDWSTGSDSELEVIRATPKVGAFPLTRGSKDAAMVVVLPPGNYTAQVSGNAGGEGVALIEVYEVP